MKISEITERISLEFVCGDPDLEVTKGCVGDLLSEVMRSCESESIWITVQSHVNTVAVAVVVGIRAIVLCNGYDYESETVARAREEGIVLLKTPLDPFTVSGKIYALLKGD